MINTSEFEPRGRAVLVRMIELDELKAALIKIPDSVRANSATLEQRAEVIAIGGSAWEDEKEPRAQVGDKVIVTRLAGYMAKSKIDGQLYRMVNDRDIFCRIREVANG